MNIEIFSQNIRHQLRLFDDHLTHDCTRFVKEERGQNRITIHVRHFLHTSTIILEDRIAYSLIVSFHPLTNNPQQRNPINNHHKYSFVR